MTERELKSFESIAKSRTGQVFVGYIKRLVTEQKDFTTIPDLSNPIEAIKVRSEVIKFLTENLLDKFKVLSQDFGDNQEEYI